MTFNVLMAADPEHDRFINERIIAGKRLMQNEYLFKIKKSLTLDKAKQE